MKHLGTVQMQNTGVHYMGANTQTESNDVMITSESNDQQLADSILEKTSGFKDGSDKELFATGYTVVIKPYPKNPYREVKKTESGLIIGGDAFSDRFKSENTGEEERAEQFIACGQVVSAGPECKYVAVGDDIYYRNSVVPVPFCSKGYVALSEQNIICKVIDKICKN